MLEQQLDLFPEGRPGRGTAGEKTRPIASLPTDLDAGSSLAAAISGFHGYMIRQGFSDNTIKSFQADLRLFSKYVAANRTIGTIRQADLEQFLTWMRADRGVPCSPKSYARRSDDPEGVFRLAGRIGSDPQRPGGADPA